MTLDPARHFDQTFQAMTGHVPMPWQKRLHEQFITGQFPYPLSLPTGLGKTTVIHIWLLALATKPTRVPRRLVYVVNRRTIVDQATREAEKLRDALRKPELGEITARLRTLCGIENDDADLPPLAISTLRGQFADNGEWRADPARPAIIIGTVDMIGSRLLFNGYRTGSWQRARHAGLLGQDTLVVHDEAHLEPAFQNLLEWIARRQRDDGSPRPLRIVPMSATGRTGKGDNPFVLDTDDLQHPRVIERLNAAKRLYLHDPKETKLADHLIRLAWGHADRKVRVIIYVRQPECAAKVFSGLLDRLGKSGQDGRNRVALLTGRIRGHEREQLVARPAIAGLLQPYDPEGRRIAPEQTTYLVATSAGEVGADFDADHLVCDLAPIDAMIQRFGRVNRRGDAGREARIDVVLDQPEMAARKRGGDKPPSPLDQARLATADLLGKLADFPTPTPEGSSKDASPAALGELVRLHPDDYAAAKSPEPTTITPHEVVLDAWTLTSIQEDWSLSQDVHPYLHGLDEQAPETYVAWRTEIGEIDQAADPDTIEEAVRTILRHYPLRPLELLREKPQPVAELLLALARHEPAARTWVVRIRQRTILPPQRLGELVQDTSDARQLASQLRYETLILAPSIGGLDAAGMLAVPDVKNGLPTPVLDVADRPPSPADQRPKEPDRRRVLLIRGQDDQWHTRTLTAETPAPDDEPEQAYPKWTVARDRWGQDHGMKCVGRALLAETEDGPSRWLLFFAAKEAAKLRVGRQRVGLDEHHQTVRSIVARMAMALGVDDMLRQALGAAAEKHDLGKADPRWQAMIANDEPDHPLAKSFGQPFDAKLLDGYRHEFGSLLSMAERLPADGIRDLVLHLVAAHHGRARPHFERRAMTDVAGLQTTLPPPLQPSEVACRFARLQRTFGHWGLAWLESILMAADGEGSGLAATILDELEEDET